MPLFFATDSHQAPGGTQQNLLQLDAIGVRTGLGVITPGYRPVRHVAYAGQPNRRNLLAFELVNVWVVC